VDSNHIFSADLISITLSGPSGEGRKGFCIHPKHRPSNPLTSLIVGRGPIVSKEQDAWRRADALT